MKTQSNRIMLWTMVLGFLFTLSSVQAQIENHSEYKGEVVDALTDDALESVNIKLVADNLGTITNNEGSFNLKVPSDQKDASVEFSLLGYKTVIVPLAELSPDGNKIRMFKKVTQLSEVRVSTYTNAENLIKEVFKRKEVNNPDRSSRMTAFYRETIKKRNRNVSLTEAVVNVYKQPYQTTHKDVITLHKARKSTDYKRLDTVALKLQGGPFSTLYLDIMKYPEYIFTHETIPMYRFTMRPPTNMKDRHVYVVHFKLKEGITDDAGYSGELFIDTETLALNAAEYQLDITPRVAADEDFFVRRKPKNISVTPLRAEYRVDYREKDGLWYYGYGNVELTFKVNDRRKIFNTTYTLSSEMAVTDWEQVQDWKKTVRTQNRLRPTIVMSDEVSGFSDPDFWGPYNLIEPEKSIESAINKIRRRLRRSGGAAQ